MSIGVGLLRRQFHGSFKEAEAGLAPRRSPSEPLELYVRRDRGLRLILSLRERERREKRERESKGEMKQERHRQNLADAGQQLVTLSLDLAG